MLPEKNNDTMTSTEPKVPKQINPTSTTFPWDPTDEEVEAATTTNDPIGALRLQRASSLDWEIRQYARRKAAERDHRVTASHESRSQPNFLRKVTIKFAEILPTRTKD